MSASSFRDRCRRLGWILGLPGLALILGLGLSRTTPDIEARLDAGAAAIARATAEPDSEPWLRFEARGRDLAVLGEAPDAGMRESAYRQLAALPGLRRLAGPVGVVEAVTPFVWTATRTKPDRIDLTGNRPAAIGPSALAERLAPALPAETRLRDRARAALGAPPDFTEAAFFALTALGHLAPGGHATLQDTTLSLAGEAASVADEVTLRAALATPPTGYAVGTVAIVPALVRDFRFGIDRAPGGGLRLSGYVVSEADRTDLRKRATEAADGAGITDETRNARGLAAGIDPKALTGFALRVVALLQEGGATFAEGAVTVSGVALDGQALGEIAGLMRDQRPAGIAAGPVSLETRPLSPYRLAIRRDSDSVTLSGHLPDPATRDRLLASLRPRFFRERIVDRSRMAEGAPADLATALEPAIGSLALLAQGEIRLADRRLTLAGRTLYAETGRRIAADFSRALPAGWQGAATIAGPDAMEPLDPNLCRTRFAGLIAGAPLRFAPASAILAPAFYPVLDGLAAWAKACPDGRITVMGHRDAPGAAPAPKPALDTAVESTASLDDQAKADPAPGTKPSGAKPSSANAPNAKPAAAKPAPAQATDTKATEIKAAEAKATEAKAAVTKAAVIKAAEAKGPPAKKSAPTEAKSAAPAEPEPDLPRQRALVVTEYLLQAGIPADRISAAPAGTQPPAGAGLGFTLVP